MTSLLALWSSVIPEIPLVLAHGPLLCAGTCIALVVCAVALWFERERPIQLPKPGHFGDDLERLAA